MRDSDVTALRNASHRLVRLQQLTAALSRASTADHVVIAVANHGLEPLEACAGFVALIEGDTHLAITRALGPNEPALPSCRFPLSARVPAADAVRQKAPVLLECVDARLERYPAWTSGRWSGYGAWAALPLLADDEPLGAILLCFPERRVFTHEDRTFMQTVATVCAQALDRARLFDREQRTREELELANARVAEADRRKDEFLATLGHELRNPLAAIVTALELAKLRGAEPAKEQRVIDRQVQNLVRLANDLVDVSRITRGAIELTREPMELASAIPATIEVVQPLAARKKQRLDVSIEERGLLVSGDCFRLSQALTNLLTNAVRYTQESGVIAVRARREGAAVLVSVKDNGIGISPELLPRIFDLFVQAASSVHTGGLGIGLTLARRLIEMHDGTLTAASDGLGKGSEFLVRLPTLDALDSDGSSGTPSP